MFDLGNIISVLMTPRSKSYWLRKTLLAVKEESGYINKPYVIDSFINQPIAVEIMKALNVTNGHAILPAIISNSSNIAAFCNNCDIIKDTDLYTELDGFLTIRFNRLLKNSFGLTASLSSFLQYSADARNAAFGSHPNGCDILACLNTVWETLLLSAEQYKLLEEQGFELDTKLSYVINTGMVWCPICIPQPHIISKHDDWEKQINTLPNNVKKDLGVIKVLHYTIDNPYIEKRCVEIYLKSSITGNNVIENMTN